ncbi:5'-nucleotidase C-terminal domain-containing protein [Bizionia paragorgiae]|uniref:5'-nucleotidase C-terminal domain-containing protein n=1 Tax=Bizionia paragorgiae TaxID=283786 RepID=UPI003A94B65E
MKFKFLFLLLVLLCFSNCKEEKFTLTKIEGKQIPITDSLELDPTFDAVIKPYRDRLQEDMNLVLSYAPETYSKADGDFNTAIGNLMADIVYEQSKDVFKSRTSNDIDGVLLNHGGIRSIISKGNITTKTAFEIMPFENSIIVVALKGKQIDSMMHYLARAKRAHPIQGFKLSIDKDYNIVKALVKGKAIDTAKTYYVATNDYLVNGGDNMNFFARNEGEYPLDYKIRNALIDYFKKTDTINPIIDDRFIQIK